MNSLPASFGALHGNPAAVRLDDALHQAQAEAGALHLRGDDVGGAVERLEDALPDPRARCRCRDR